tara:strand:+ start:152 stop:1141 length:990 start_codon:yes stop_codon:yes gene_type:complete
MIITPEKLQNWIEKNKQIRVIDIRSENQVEEFPTGITEAMISSVESLPLLNSCPNILICQFGVITEDIISSRDLDNCYSLLGGALAWINYEIEKTDISRWSRQIALPEVGLEGQKKLNNSKVAVVGLGGLGCPVANNLAASGVGFIRLIDGDFVELSNLHRQPIYNLDDIKNNKALAALSHLSKKYDTIKFEAVPDMLNTKNSRKLLKDVDIIIDATDNIKTRLEVDKISKSQKIPMIYGGLYRFEGQVSIFNFNGSPSYQDLFPKKSKTNDKCSEAGVLGMLPGIIGNIQALETVKLIIGIESVIIGKLLIYDSLTHIINIMDYSKLK